MNERYFLTYPYIQQGSQQLTRQKGVQLSSHFLFTILTCDLRDALEAINFTNPFMSKETQSSTIIP